MFETFLRIDTDGVERRYLARGGVQDADNFSASLTPAVSEGDLSETLRRLLAPGWEANFRPHQMPLFNEVTASMHLGGVLVRDGQVLEMSRAFRAGAPMPRMAISALFAEMASELTACLEAEGASR